MGLDVLFSIFGLFDFRFLIFCLFGVLIFLGVRFFMLLLLDFVYVVFFLFGPNTLSLSDPIYDPISWQSGTMKCQAFCVTIFVAFFIEYMILLFNFLLKIWFSNFLLNYFM